MNDETRKWLFDIIASIDSINSYVGNRKIFEDYEKIKSFTFIAGRGTGVIERLIQK